MKKIYILLMHTRTIPARIIRKVTNYEYSHVGICLDKDCNAIYSFGRKHLHYVLDAGFLVEYKDGEFFKTFNKTKCKIYEVEVTNKQYNEVKKILNDMLNNNEKYKYDFFGIIPRYFGIPITIKNRYVCSYFVASILEKANIHNFEKDVCFVNPKDFENIQGFNEIYSGNYTNYKATKSL